jgi:polar amino acid transport system ATP-binding protein
VNGAPPVLELRGHEGLRRREVLRGIDLAVGEHRAVALIGASGSGKSTLLRCVDLLDEIDEGDVFLDGEVITDPSRRPVAVRRRLGLVFQAYNLFPHLTVLQNVVLAPVRAHGMPRAEARERARELLARFGLAGREGDYPDRLSGGQQQRVAIVRALATRPRALLLDEVTSALDPELVGEVLALIRDLKGEGMTMMIATHEMAFAREVADEVCFLHEGRILERGEPERIFRHPGSPRPASSCGASWSPGDSDQRGARSMRAISARSAAKPWRISSRSAAMSERTSVRSSLNSDRRPLNSDRRPLKSARIAWKA